MSKLMRTFLIGIAPIALLGMGAEVLAQADDVDCTRCVDTKDIAPQAVATGRIAQQAVTTNKIHKAAVTTSKLAQRAVTTQKIKDGAVTTKKVAPELSNAIGTFCAPGESVVGMDANGNFVCERFYQDCIFANGLRWCFDNTTCGEACNDVCASKGLTPLADQDVWLNAQNSTAKCQVIAAAFNVDDGIVIDSPNACIVDSNIDTHSVGGGLVARLICSTDATCPGTHLTNMSSFGLACDNPLARRSVCPCE